MASPKEETLAELARELEACTACHLRGDCLAPVGWFGAADSPLVIVAEGPGGVEDAYGCPLIGPSGQLLDKALWSVGITRDRILTTNVIKCRPRGNRTPTLEEADFCAKRFLFRELACLQPKVIVALGNVALHYLLMAVNIFAPVFSAGIYAYMIVSAFQHISLIIGHHLRIYLIYIDGMRIVHHIRCVSACRSHIDFKPDKVAYFSEIRTRFGKFEKFKMHESALYIECF